MAKQGSAPNNEEWVVTRDGVEKFRGTESKCMWWMHNNHPASISHQTRYEGYSMVPAFLWDASEAVYDVTPRKEE